MHKDLYSNINRLKGYIILGTLLKNQSIFVVPEIKMRALLLSSLFYFIEIVFNLFRENLCSLQYVLTYARKVSEGLNTDDLAVTFK